VAAAADGVSYTIITSRSHGDVFAPPAAPRPTSSSSSYKRAYCLLLLLPVSPRGCMAFFRFNDVKRCFSIFFIFFVYTQRRARCVCMRETKGFPLFFYGRKSFSPHKLFLRELAAEVPCALQVPARTLRTIFPRTHKPRVTFLL